MTADTDPSGTSGHAPTQADYRALATFRYALRRFSAFSEEAAMSAGLMPQQHQALLVIKAMSTEDLAPSVGDIAAHLLIRHHSAVELVNRLVRMALVRREKDPSDGRRVRVALTELAEIKLAALSSAHLQELKAIRPELVRLLRHFKG
jgi:DNA-binding MarR family transcriptional regulator